MNAPTAEEHLGLVHLCANRFRGRGMEYEDLYSAGCIGLLKAVKAFDCAPWCAIFHLCCSGHSRRNQTTVSRWRSGESQPFPQRTRHANPTVTRTVSTETRQGCHADRTGRAFRAFGRSHCRIPLCCTAGRSR